MIKIVQHGDFRKADNFFQRLLQIFDKGLLNKYGERGVEALRASTPVDSGKTANSWDYVIEHKKDSFSIVWTNSNLNEGVNIAVILQYGHATGTGGYVRGIDYINPALRPVFQGIADDIWKEVTSR